MKAHCKKCDQAFEVDSPEYGICKFCDGELEFFESEKSKPVKKKKAEEVGDE
jgi:hypothetical protein